jgi:biotin carboxyl carrier protein
VDGGKSETLRASKGGKVKTISAKDGDTVSKGDVLVSFDDGGANADEIATLRDRIASEEGADSDEAKKDLKASKDKLAALQSKGGGPIVAGMSGKLVGFSVGAVLKSGETVGRIVDGEAPKRVRVNVDRNTKVRKGQNVTLVLKRGGEGAGTVASVNGRTISVDTGDLSGDEVDAVRF